MADMQEAMRKSGFQRSNPPGSGPSQGQRPPRGGQQRVAAREDEPLGSPPDGGYFDDNLPSRPLKPWYLAPSTCRGLLWKWKRDKNSFTRTQLRRFFNHCAVIRQRLKDDPERPWEAERESFGMLPAYAGDALGKKKAPESFVKFLEEHVQRVHDRNDFLRGFMPHFEAVVGFSPLIIGR